MRRDQEGKLLEHALAALRHATGLQARVVAMEPKTAEGARPDAAIEIQADGKRFRFLVEIKAIDRAVALATAKDQLEPFGRGLGRVGRVGVTGPPSGPPSLTASA